VKQTELKQYRQRLEALIRRLTGEQTTLRHEALGENVPGENYAEDDLSRMHTDEEVAMSLLDNEEGLLGECEAALQRLDRGTFGACESCGKPIAAKRLLVLPHTRVCIRCAKTAKTAKTA